jgi:hypothetical protein
MLNNEVFVECTAFNFRFLIKKFSGCRVKQASENPQNQNQSALPSKAGLIDSKNERPTPARNGKYQVHRTGAVDSKNKDKCL